MSSPEPLRLDLPKAMLPHLSPLILATADRLERELRKIDSNVRVAAAIREGYIAGLYAAAAAINGEGADARQISETAGYIERQR